MSDNMNVAAVSSQLTQQSAISPRVEAAPHGQEAVVPAQKSQDSAAAAAKQAAASVAELQAAIEKLNEFMAQGKRSLSFSVDDSLGEVVVQVTDTQTQELVRQIPNEEALKLKQHLEGMLGLLFSDRA